MSLAPVLSFPVLPGNAAWNQCIPRNLAAEAERLAENLVEGALLEAACDPKPGLVCASGSGIHTDMTIRTFMSGAMALHAPFAQSARMGLAHTGSAAALFAALRTRGPEWEARLLRATGGVNTHRGLLFSGCLIAGAAGSLMAESPPGGGPPDRMLRPTVTAICRRAGIMAQGLCVRDFNRNRKATETHGERLYKQYGFRGIRGEAENGLPAILRGPPALYAALQAGLSVNPALLHALVHIVPEMEDTTVLHRSGPEDLDWLRSTARLARDLGGMLTAKGSRVWNQLCAEAGARRVSPGGCADMLALCAGLYLFREGCWPTAIL